MGEAPARRRDCLDHPSPQEPLVHVSPVVPSAVSSITEEGEVPGGGSLMVAVRLADLVSPAGRPLGEGDRSALAVGGTARIRTGEPVVFCKIVAVAPAQVRRGGGGGGGRGPPAPAGRGAAGGRGGGRGGAGGGCRGGGGGGGAAGGVEGGTGRARAGGRLM